MSAGLSDGDRNLGSSFGAIQARKCQERTSAFEWLFGREMSLNTRPQLAESSSSNRPQSSPLRPVTLQIFPKDCHGQVAILELVGAKAKYRAHGRVIAVLGKPI
jgi:hypothetical protein